MSDYGYGGTTTQSESTHNGTPSLSNDNNPYTKPSTQNTSSEPTGKKWTLSDIEKMFPYKGLYKPYVVNVDDNIPDDKLEKLRQLMYALDAEGWTVRVPASKEKIIQVSGIKMEIYKPFKAFTCKYQESDLVLPRTPTMNVGKLAKAILPGFSNIPEKALTFIVNELALIVGYAMNSICEFVVVYTPDGCNRVSGITKETGYMRGTITNATMLNRPIFNINNDGEGSETMKYASKYIKEII